MSVMVPDSPNTRTKLDWRQWTLRRWNDALVDIVFARRPDTPPEIVHIDATNRLLLEVTKSDPKDASDARQFFLNSFPRVRSDFSLLFDTSVQTRNWSAKDADLPFFAQLYLTILVASADQETFEIGNFRDRLQALLGFDLSVGRRLNDLPNLWKAAARWTEDTRRLNVRHLILPSPESEVIIGHSKRLAFPGFSDQTKLAKLLTNSNLDAGSPEKALISVVAKNRHRFSRRFGEEFDDFLRSLRRGDRLNAYRSPFWGAIVEINWEARAAKPRRRDGEFELELDPTDPYTANLVLVASGQADLGKPWKYKQLAFAVGQMKYQVIADDASNQLLLDQLRSNAGRQLLSGTRIFDWLSRGWIGFCRDDSERWVASSDLTRPGRLWLLVNDVRWRRVENALGTTTHRPDYMLKGIVSDGWVLAGPLKNTPGLRELLQKALGDQELVRRAIMSTADARR